MQSLRAKINARLIDGMIRLTVDWVRVSESEVPGETQFTEEFQVPVDRNVSYFSKVAIPEAITAKLEPNNVLTSEDTITLKLELPIKGGTFWVDEGGKRHFIVDADSAVFGLTGESAKII